MGEISQLNHLPPDGTGEGSRTVINLNDEDDLEKFKTRFPTYVFHL